MRVLAMRWNTPPSGRDPVVGHQSWWGATSRRVRISGVRQRTLLEPSTVASTSQSGGPRPRSFRSDRELTPTSGALCVRTGHSFFGGCIPPPVRGDLSAGHVHERMLGPHTSPLGSLEGWPPGMGFTLRGPGGGGVWENWVFVWKTFFCVCVRFLRLLVLCRLSIVPSQNLRHRPAFEGQRVSLACFPSGRGSPCLVGRAA